MLFSVYKSGNEKIWSAETSDCENGITVNFEPFNVSSTDPVDLSIKADTTVLNTTPNDDSFVLYISNISGYFSNNEKWALSQCPNNSMPFYSNVLKY